MSAAAPAGLAAAAAWLGQISALGIAPDRVTVERIRDYCHSDAPCPDCAAPLGQAHDEECDVAQCLETGTQRLSCGVFGPRAPGHDCGCDVWNGMWPGFEAAIELGAYVEASGALPPCGPEHPRAMPDLNVVRLHCGWSRTERRWVPLPGALGLGPARAARARARAARVRSHG